MVPDRICRFAVFFAAHQDNEAAETANSRRHAPGLHPRASAGRRGRARWTNGRCSRRRTRSSQYRADRSGGTGQPSRDIDQTAPTRDFQTRPGRSAPRASDRRTQDSQRAAPTTDSREQGDLRVLRAKGCRDDSGQRNHRPPRRRQDSRGRIKGAGAKSGESAQGGREDRSEAMPQMQEAQAPDRVPQERIESRRPCKMVQDVQDQGGQGIATEASFVTARRRPTGRHVRRCPTVRAAPSADRPAQERTPSCRPCREQGRSDQAARAQVPPIPKPVVLAGPALPQETEATRARQCRRHTGAG